MKKTLFVLLVIAPFAAMAYILFNGYPEPFGLYAGLAIGLIGFAMTVGGMRHEINK